VSPLARLLVTAGLLLVAVGLLLPWLSRLPLGHLPGDIAIQRPHLRIYLPVTTCVVASVVVSLLIWLLRR